MRAPQAHLPLDILGGLDLMELTFYSRFTLATRIPTTSWGIIRILKATVAW